MRNALRSLKCHKVKGLVRILLASCLMVGAAACSTLGLNKQAPQPDLVGDRPDEVNWSFADATRLQEEISQLKSENERLKTEISGLRDAKDKAEARVLALAEAPQQEADEAPASTPQTPTPAPGKAVVAAAEADQALADAPPPVERSPRLVQQSISDDETVFENEAGGQVQDASDLFGVHLASYKTVEKARSGWSELQRSFPDELGLLEARIEQVRLPERGVFLRLIGGGFSSQTKASMLCDLLNGKGRYCSVASFAGERLSLAEAAG